jgi:hypothetical protein
MDVMTTTMASNRPPKKPPPPNLQRSGKPAPKGKGRAKAPTPEVDDQADQTWQGVTFLDDEPPAYKGKKKRKQRLEAEAEEAMAWETPPVRKDIWGTAQQAEPSQEEVNCFLSYRNNPRMDLDVEIASLSIETSEASRPTLLWSASSEQYLQPPPERRGTHQVHCQKCRSGVEALRCLGIHKNPTPHTEDAGTFSRPGNHLADIADLLHRRKICSSERRSSTCTSTDARTR